MTRTDGDDRLAVGVVGVGSMGAAHARLYTELPHVDLVGVTDEDGTRAAQVAERTGTDALDRRALFRTADALSIATPTPTHASLAREAIDAGVHVLVEKPFVPEPAVGRDLIDRATRAGVTLQVGHVERFNPALAAARSILEGAAPIAIEARRLGPPPDRTAAEDAVFDLMVHDIDVVRTLVDEPVTDVAASGTADGQYVDATLRVGGELVVGLTASRVTQRPVRELSVTTREQHVEIDFLEQTVAIHRRSTGTGADERVVAYPTVERGEPLRRELTAFVDAVRNGADPAVDGTDGVETVALARRIRDAARTSPEAVAR